jgi:hypothetical protein
MLFFIEIEKIQKVRWKHKRSQIAKGILSKNSSTGDITVSHFKLYYISIIANTAWYWHKTDT